MIWSYECMDHDYAASNVAWQHHMLLYAFFMMGGLISSRDEFSFHFWLCTHAHVHLYHNHFQ